MNLKEIENLAEEVISAHGIDVPVCPKKIATQESIRLAPGDYDGCFDGRIEYHKRAPVGRFYLFYAKACPTIRPPGRVRFSIAHELGHYFLPEHRRYLKSGVCHGSHSGFVSKRPQEREADQFAASLLMPRRQFIQHVRACPGDVCTLKDLSRLAEDVFKSSFSSTVIRYVHLGFEPCCVVLSREGKILYGRSSDEMRIMGLGWVERDQPLPRGSVTRELLEDASNLQPDKAEGRVESSVWFARGRDIKLWEETQVLGNTGLTLTFLAPAD